MFFFLNIVVLNVVVIKHYPEFLRLVSDVLMTYTQIVPPAPP